MANSDGQTIISTEMASKLLDLTPRRLRQLAEEGRIDRIGRDQWSVVSVVRGYVAYLKDRERIAREEGVAAKATDARTREIEQRIAIRDRELIPLEDAYEAYQNIAGIYLTSFSSLPARISRNVRERGRIDRILDEERERLADKFEKIGRRLLADADRLEAKSAKEGKG